MSSTTALNARYRYFFLKECPNVAIFPLTRIFSAFRKNQYTGMWSFIFSAILMMVTPIFFLATLITTSLALLIGLVGIFSMPILYPIVKIKKDPFEALQEAFAKKDYTRFKVLLENNKKLVNYQDAKANTPLHWAVAIDNLEIIELLINIPGINCNARNIEDQTAATLRESDIEYFIRDSLTAKIIIEGRELFAALPNGELDTARGAAAVFLYHQLLYGYKLEGRLRLPPVPRRCALYARNPVSTL